MLKNKSQNKKSPHFQRKVIQIAPEERDRIHQTSKQAFSNVQHGSERVINGKDMKYSPKHRDFYFPLLIKIFSLQEQIHNLRSSTHVAFPDQTSIKSPDEIQEELSQIILEIKESQKWNEGVIAQAEKGLNELNELLPKEHVQEKAGWIKRLMNLLKKK